MAEIDGAEELIREIEAARLPAPNMRRRIRTDAGATLRDIASALGVSPMTVLRWESGKSVRRENAIAYRTLLDALRKVTTS